MIPLQSVTYLIFNKNYRNEAEVGVVAVVIPRQKMVLNGCLELFTGKSVSFFFTVTTVTKLRIKEERINSGKCYSFVTPFSNSPLFWFTVTLLLQTVTLLLQPVVTLLLHYKLLINNIIKECVTVNSSISEVRKIFSNE
jgi:CBS domain containing-hemolysin-like protein